MIVGLLLFVRFLVDVVCVWVFLVCDGCLNWLYKCVGNWWVCCCVVVLVFVVFLGVFVGSVILWGWVWVLKFYWGDFWFFVWWNELVVLGIGFLLLLLFMLFFFFGRVCNFVLLIFGDSYFYC